MSTTQTEKVKRLIASDARRATRWYCGSLIALASAVFILLTEASPIGSTVFAGAIPGGPVLPWLAVVQLGIAAVAQSLKARAIRRDPQFTAAAPERFSVAAYGLIVLFGALGLLRGPQSGLLIAGYDDLLAAVLTSAVVSLALHVLDVRDSQMIETTTEQKTPTTASKTRPTRWVEGIAAAALASGWVIAEVAG